MNSDANWTQAVQHMQETFGAGLQQSMGAFGGVRPAGTQTGAAGFPSMDFSKLAPPAFQLPSQPQITFDAAQLQKIQQSYLEDAAALWMQTLQPGAASQVMPDKRFSAEAWSDNPVAKFSAAS